MDGDKVSRGFTDRDGHQLTAYLIPIEHDPLIMTAKSCLRFSCVDQGTYPS